MNKNKKTFEFNTKTKCLLWNLYVSSRIIEESYVITASINPEESNLYSFDKLFERYFTFTYIDISFDREKLPPYPSEAIFSAHLVFFHKILIGKVNFPGLDKIFHLTEKSTRKSIAQLDQRRQPTGYFYILPIPNARNHNMCSATFFHKVFHIYEEHITLENQILSINQFKSLIKKEIVPKIFGNYYHDLKSDLLDGTTRHKRLRAEAHRLGLKTVISPEELTEEHHPLSTMILDINHITDVDLGEQDQEVEAPKLIKNR